MKLSLEELDHHLNNIRAQLQFLNERLEATDHNAPDWLATDLVSLRNKSGRLHDDMKRFRDHLDAEGLAEKKSKTTNKRLSIEGAKPKTHTPTSHTPIPQQNAISPPIDPSPTPRAKPTQAEEDAYEVQRIDVTEEVNRRLRESRLRRLMETPTTSHKRKYDAYEEPRSGSTIGRDDEADSRGWSGSEYERTPTKRIKCSGTFEQLGKRKENGSADTGSSGKHDNRTNIKRRRV